MSKPQILWWVIYGNGKVWTEGGWQQCDSDSAVTQPLLFQNKSLAKVLIKELKYEAEDEEELKELKSCIIVPCTFTFPT